MGHSNRSPRPFVGAAPWATSVDVTVSITTIHRMDTKSGETKDLIVERLAQARERTRWLPRHTGCGNTALNQEIAAPLVRRGDALREE